MERAQIRAARALLGWSQEDLAQASGVSVPTIKRIEPGHGPLKATDDVQAKIERAFVGAGIEFIASDEFSGSGGMGVRVAVTDDYTRLRTLQRRLNEANQALQAASRLTTDGHLHEAVMEARSALFNAIPLVSQALDREYQRFAEDDRPPRD